MKRIAIHGVPRSGTTWLGSIIDSNPHIWYCHQPLFSYSLKGFLSETSSLSEIKEFYERLLKTKDNFILQKEGKMQKIIPEFRKENITHIAYKEARYHNILPNLLEKDKEIKILGIIRNPKAVLASWYNAPKEFDKQKWVFEEEWMDAEKKNEFKKEEFYGYSKWKECAEMFLQLSSKYPSNFKIVNYSNLIKNPVDETQGIFNFLDIKMCSQTSEFLETSTSVDKSDEAYSVYRIKNKDDNWRKILPKQIIERIDNDLKNSELENFNS